MSVDPRDFVVSAGDQVEDVNLEQEDVRLQDGRRLTPDLAEQLAREAARELTSPSGLHTVRWAYRRGYRDSISNRRWFAWDAVHVELARSIAHDVAFDREPDARDIALFRRVRAIKDRLQGFA